MGIGTLYVPEAMGSGRGLLCFCIVVFINFFELLGVVVSLWCTIIVTAHE